MTASRDAVKKTTLRFAAALSVVVLSACAGSENAPGAGTQSSGAESGGAGGGGAGDGPGAGGAGASSVGGSGAAGGGGGGVDTNLVSEAVTPSWLTLDGSDVFWVEDERVARAPKSGGVALELATSSPGTPYASGGIAVDTSSVYWTSAPSESAGWIHRVDLAGGEVDDVVPVEHDVPGGLALRGASMFWGNQATSGGSVMGLPITGGSAMPLASGAHAGAFRLVADDENVFFVTLPWVGSVDAVPIGGGAVVPLVIDEPGACAIAVDATHLYWAVAGEVALIKSIAKTGGAAVVLASTAEVVPGTHDVGIGHLMVDDAHVYWTWGGTYTLEADVITTNDDGRVFRVPKAGGDASIVASGGSPWGLALDATHVYWADAGQTVAGQYTGGGAIRRAAK